MGVGGGGGVGPDPAFPLFLFTTIIFRIPNVCHLRLEYRFSFSTLFGA